MSLAAQTTPLIAALEQLGPHNHLCSIYESPEEHYAVAIPFIRIGLDRNEKCIYIADDGMVGDVRQAMQSDGIDVDRAISSNALVLVTKEQAYLEHGSFHPDWMSTFWKQATQLAISEGFSALRATGETEWVQKWVLREDSGLERWMEYESRLAHTVAENNCSALCQYNRRLFPPELILDVIRTHPVVVNGGTVSRNLYYVPPEEFLGTNQTGREVERLLTNIREREQVEDALREQLTERRRAEALLAGEKRLLEMIAKGDLLAPILEALCRLVEELSSGALSSILLLDSTGKRLSHGAAPSLPGSYTEAINGALIGPSAGSCGTAAYRKESVLVSDIATDPLWIDYRDLALAHGLKACWSTPILSSDGRLLGTFAIYSREPRSPNPQQRTIIEQTTHLASIAIERKQAEGALHRAQAELAHVTRVMTMGELVASIAHEVNQPLGAIVTNGSACLRLLSRETPDLDQSREVIRRMINDGMRASEVLKRIRDLLHKSPPEKAPLNINETVQEVIEMVSSDVLRSKVELQAELAADLPPVVGDRIQLQQVILNLMLNAKDAMSEVQTHSHVLLIRSRKNESGGVVVAVQDSGKGLDAKDAERIFDPFFTTKAEGMGLGLTISRRIIEDHHGMLWATANEDKGATMQFSLPSGTGES